MADEYETQNEALLRLLRAAGKDGVTPIEALHEIGSLRLSARIFDLRNRGLSIETTRPKGHPYARYILHG